MKSAMPLVALALISFQQSAASTQTDMIELAARNEHITRMRKVITS
jgi:hypothetical protein